MITSRKLPWQKVPGHLKGDGAYVLSRKPDYVILGPAEGTTIETPWFLSGLEMSRDPRFEANYSVRQVDLDASDQEGFRQYGPTRTGVLTFTYYERRGRPAHREPGIVVGLGRLSDRRVPPPPRGAGFHGRFSGAK